jgi:transcriptional adapter 2-alpha
MLQGEENGAAAEELDGVCAEGASAEADSDAANDPRRKKTEDAGERPSIIAGATPGECDADEAESKADEEMEDQDRSNSDKAAAAAAHADASADGRDVDRKRESRPQRYRVVDETKNAWTAEEDLRLLDGILVCGLGNWPDIAEHVIGSGGGEGGGGGSGGGDGANSGGKTDKQCMERYLDDYMGRYGYILPPYTMVPEPEEEGGGGGDDREGDSKSGAAPDGPDCDGAVRKRPRRSVSSAVLEDDDSAPGFRRTKFRVVPTEELEECKDLWPHPYIPPNTGARMGDEVARDLWYRSEQYFVRQTTGAASKVDAEAIRTEFIERRAQNLAGYEAKVLPPRLEDMKQLPGAELAGYMPRRGDFDMEWDNDAEKTIAEMEFSSDDTKADRELKLDVLRIFNTKLDERERRKQFIVDHGLLNYRKNQEKLWRMPPDERHLVQRMRLFARFHTREEHEAFVNKIIEAKRLRKEIAKLQMYRRMGITSLADAEKYEMDKVRRELHRDAWIKKEEQKRKAAEEAVRAARENATVLMPPPPPVPAPVSKLEGPVGAEANQSLQVWRQFKRFKKNGSESKSSGNLDNENAKFVIRDKPGYELLSKKEAALCKRLRLLPQNYLDVKKALISESLAQGIWRTASAPKQNRSIFKVDVTQRDNIIDFVLEAGWIPTRPSIID